MFVVRMRKTVSRCLLQLTSEMTPYTTSTEQGSDEFLRNVIETKMMGKKRESMKNAF